MDDIPAAEPRKQSILNDVKKMLGLGADYTPFDAELIIFINTTIMELQQLGVRSDVPGGFHIASDRETWGDYLGPVMDLDMIQSYIYLSVQTLFDPPSLSSVLTARKELMDKYSWRIMAQVESWKEDPRYVY